MTDVENWDIGGKLQLLTEKLGLEQTEISFLNAFAQSMADHHGVEDLEDFKIDFTAREESPGFLTAAALVDILETSGLEEAIRFKAIKAKLLAAGEKILPGSPPPDEITLAWYEADFDHDESPFTTIISKNVSRRLKNQLRVARSDDKEIRRELIRRNQNPRPRR